MATVCRALCSFFYIFGMIGCNANEQNIINFAEQCIAEEKYSFVNSFYGQDLDLVYQFNGKNTHYLSLGLR